MRNRTGEAAAEAVLSGFIMFWKLLAQSMLRGNVNYDIDFREALEIKVVYCKRTVNIAVKADV